MARYRRPALTRGPRPHQADYEPHHGEPQAEIAEARLQLAALASAAALHAGSSLRVTGGTGRPAGAAARRSPGKPAPHSPPPPEPDPTGPSQET